MAWITLTSALKGTKDPVVVNTKYITSMGIIKETSIWNAGTCITFDKDNDIIVEETIFEILKQIPPKEQA